MAVRFLAVPICVFIACVFLFSTSDAFAQGTVYSCRDAQGRIEFTDVKRKNGQCRIVKEMSIDIGMKADRVRQLMHGKPRVTYVKTKAGTTERWIYPDGMTLQFQDEVLEKIEQN
jgi:hypothetical protein